MFHIHTSGRLKNGEADSFDAAVRVAGGKVGYGAKDLKFIARIERKIEIDQKMVTVYLARLNEIAYKKELTYNNGDESNDNIIDSRWMSLDNVKKRSKDGTFRELMDAVATRIEDPQRNNK